MFLGNEKKKKRGGYAIAIGALAMYGAYRLISSVKCACRSGIDSMMSSVKKMKKKMPSADADCDFCNCSDDDSEPYDG